MIKVCLWTGRETRARDGALKRAEFPYVVSYEERMGRRAVQDVGRIAVVILVSAESPMKPRKVRVKFLLR